jgi:hypothetical protein
MTTLQLSCKSCGKLIPAENVNIDKAIAKCLACNAVFRFAADLGERTARAQVGLPARFTLENWGPELAITRRWYSHGLWFLLLFCLFWDGFLVVWYSIAGGMILSGEGDPMAWVMLVFPLLFVVIGAAMTYFVAASFVNKTVIRVSGGVLTIRHGPIPWPGNHSIPTTDLSQLYCTETVIRGKHGCRSIYNVEMLRSDRTKLKLLDNLQELDQAMFIEQQLEQHLNIADQRVPGEVRL